MFKLSPKNYFLGSPKQVVLHIGYLKITLNCQGKIGPTLAKVPYSFKTVIEIFTWIRNKGTT
jgi:hypothetical protein